VRVAQSEARWIGFPVNCVAPGVIHATFYLGVKRLAGCSMADLEERFASALHGTARAWRQVMDRRLKSLGLSHASWLMITVAAKAQSQLSQSELAERLGVEGATVVAMVDRLVKAGLADRQVSKVDRRIKRVVLTEAGSRLYEEMKGEAVAVRKGLLANVDPKKLALATEVLEVLQQRIAGVP
jgi:MarR family transcriptional regulator for hemolysin